MKLKQLRISGFKSFCEEAEFRFDGGLVSMIVGPNGCGKSNVADALCWVLGEQSPRFMRSTNMSDVIFNGSSDLPAVNRAEVGVLFDNSDCKALEKYNSFTEIAVTRRLYRSGESEYLINNIHCRLMDVRELLMDTGAAGRSYSIVEQGKVESFVSASSDDRRQFMEEAAGVMRYKNHRLAAERKLEQTQQNLQRVADLLAELHQQERVLFQQVSDAQRARDLQAETDQVRLALEWQHYSQRVKAVQSLIEQLAKLQKESEEVGEEHALEARLKTVEIESSLVTESLQVARAEQEKTRQIWQKDQQQQEVLTENQQQGIGWKAQIETDLKSLSERVLQTKIALKEKEKLYKELNNKFHKEQESLQRKKSNHQQYQDKFTKIEQEHQQKQNSLFAYHDNLNGINRNHQQLAEKLNRWKGAEEALANQWNELQGEKSAKQLAWQGQQKTLTALSKSFKEVEAAYQTIVAEENASLALKNKAQAEYDEWEKKRLRCALRHQALQEMQHNMEGFTVPVKQLFAWLQDNPKHASELGVCGVLSELLVASKEVLQWAGSYLTVFSEWVVIESSAALLPLATLMENEQIGGITFVALDRLPAYSNKTEDSEDSFAARLGCDDKYRPLLQGLFGAVRVRDGKAWEQVFEPNWQQKLSTDAKWLSKGIAVRMGGSGEVVIGKESEGTAEMLQRKVKLNELASDLQSLKNSCEQASKVLAKARASGDACLKVRIEYQAKLEEESQAVRACEQSWQGLKAEQQRFQRQEEQLQSELNSNRSGQKTLTTEHQTLATQINNLERDKVRLEKQFSQLPERLAQVRLSLGEVADVMANQQALCVGLEVQLTSTQKECQQLTESFKQTLSQQIEHQTRWQNWQEEEVKKSSRKKQLKEQIAQMKKTYSEQQKKTLGIEKKFRQHEIEHTKIASKIKQIRGIQNKHSQNKHVLELKLAEEQVRLEQAIEKIKPLLEKITPPVGDTKENFQPNTDEIFKVLPSDLLQVLPSSLSTLSKNQLESKLVKGEKNMQKLHNINMAAPEEHKKLRERTTHMEDQQVDLQSAIKDLHTSIIRLNQESQRRFSETFKAVNAKFEELFSNIFGGGKASLSLTKQGDLLNTGIDIYAHPPGKKLQNISLLSGGEKALTAIALIFAFFLHKPSPFCLLDEVDAPLDDVNIDRFNQLVRTMATRTQFVIITHNKRTMAMGDNLYGITMEKAGVSRIVSVQLSQ